MRQPIPNNISSEHILLALQFIDEHGVPKEHESTSYDLIYNNKRYPPKYVIETANTFANGTPFKTDFFSGGNESNTYLRKLGFIIERKTDVWIFQANPNRFDILSELDGSNTIEGTWLVQRYKKDIRNGDVGLIWKSQSERGIYAIIDIVSDPQMLIDENERNWNNKEEARTPQLRVKYRYNLKFKEPLLEEEIKKIDGLKNLSILKFRQSTNYRVTSDEWTILSDIFEKRYGYLPSKSETAFSWTIINDNVAVKKMDRSSFIHHCTGIPIEIRRYFDLSDIKQGYQRPINLIYHEQTFQANIIADVQPNPRTRLIWRENLASLIKSILPSWYQHYSANNETLEDSPEMRFIKLGQSNSFEIEFIEPKELQEDISADIDVTYEDNLLKEGKIKNYYGKRYERELKNRLKAIEIHGLTCSICGFNFEQVYGERGRGFIEIHHTKPLHSFEEEQIVNPETDLVPVCSNCHRMIHKKIDNILSIDEMKKIINRRP